MDGVTQKSEARTEELLIFGVNAKYQHQPSGSQWEHLQHNRETSGRWFKHGMNDWCGPKMNYTNSMDKFVAISCSCDRLQSNLMTSRGFVRIYNIYLLQTYWVSIYSGPSSLLHRYTDKYIKCWPQNLCRYLILLQNSNVDTGRIYFKKSLFKLILKYYFCKVVIFIANKRDAKMNAMV